MAANLRDPGSIPGGDPKRFQDSSNYVFYIVGECFSSAAGTHLATDLTCKENKKGSNVGSSVFPILPEFKPICLSFGTFIFSKPEFWEVQPNFIITT